MPLFCRKNVHSPKNTVLSFHFFQIFHEKLPAVMLIFYQKSKFCQTKRYYGPKKSIRCPFFCLSQINNRSHAHILQKKNVDSLKNTLLSCLYFVKKTSFLSKALISDIILIKFFMEKALLSSPYSVKNRQSVKTRLYYGSNKAIECPFFPFFQEKNCSHAHISYKKRPFSKKTLFFSPYFVKKTSIL